MPRLLALTVLLLGASAAAQAEPAAVTPPKGLYLGDEWRYRPTGFVGWLKGVFTRPFVDLVSIPSNYGAWDGADFATFTGTLGTAVAMAVPISGRSLDSRLQDQLHVWRGPNCAYARDATYCDPPKPSGFRVWRGGWGDAAIIGVVTGLPLALLAYGALDSDPALVEAGTLAIESFLVAEAFHVSLKLLLGREAPLADHGNGSFYGPTTANWPDGWPSGHAATIFSIAATYALYFHQPWLEVLLLGVATALSVMLVVDDTHFAGEVLVGAAIGYCSGRFVVQHRSTRYQNGEDGAPVRLVALTPLQVPGGYGLAARFGF